MNQVTICGLATDVCVKFTALDAVREGFTTRVIQNATRGVNLHEGDVARAFDEMKDAGVMWFRVSCNMFRFLPWKFFMKRAARHYGVMDPAMLMARMRRFAQPSEVAEPLELLRAGIVFHARGLVNAKAIQHNLDWVWPYWVERQFNPESSSFVPRAFSFSHINLTHRNWTAVGDPDLPLYPIVDPRGLVTPLHDGWSLDFWVISDENQLLPSKLEDDAVKQSLRLEPDLEVVTECAHGNMKLDVATRMVREKDRAPDARTHIRALSERDGWLVVAVRPYNPEGIQFIHHITADKDKQHMRVNDEATLRFDTAADGFRMAHYAEGDIYLNLADGMEQSKVDCEVGMATAAALFRLEGGQSREWMYPWVWSGI